jgi:hypothetical protein
LALPAAFTYRRTHQKQEEQMPSRTTTKAPATKAPSGKSAASSAKQAKATKRTNTGGTLAAAAATAGRKRSVKAAQTEQRTAAPVPNAAAAGLNQDQDQAARQRMVAEAAYYRAQNRGFAPGYELDDWLDAEAEIERRYATRH